MPVTDLLKAQIQSYEIGRLRAGVTDGKRPMTIDTWRFTSASEPAIDAAAAAYGGIVRPWDNRGHKEFEVITEADDLMVTLPPYAETVSMWYEMWTAGGCQRRCDSEKTLVPGGPCLCAPLLEQYAEEDRGRERAKLAKQKTPKACALQTRISVVLADLPDVGVWRYDTKSYFGTVGLLAKLKIMEMARAQGIFLPARMWIDHQVDVSDGQTRHYPVPQFSLLNTTREIVTGQLAGAGMAAQLPPAPGEERRAITGGQPPASGQEAPVPAVPKPRQPKGRTAQDIADDAANATTRADIETLQAEMATLRCEEDYVCTDRENEVHEELRGYLGQRKNELPDPGASQPAPTAARPEPRVTSGQIGIIRTHFVNLGFEDREMGEFVALIAALAAVPGLDKIGHLTQEQGLAVTGQLDKCKTRAALVDLAAGAVAAGLEG